MCFSQSANQTERITGWQSDIDTLLTLMKTQHIVYKSKKLPAGLIKSAETLKKNIDKYSDERMFMELQQLAWYMQDGHSYILPFSPKFSAYYLPVQFYIFSDGVFVIDADDANKELIGKKVLTINTVPIKKLLADMNGYIHQDNKYTVKWFAPTYLRFRSIYERYGLKPGAANVSIKYETDSKKAADKAITFIPAHNFHGIPKLFPSKISTSNPVPLYLQQVDNFFWYKEMPEHHCLYIQFNQVVHKKNESLFRFGDRIDSVLKSVKPNLLIVDVRHNNGGSLEYLSNLVKAITNFEKTYPGAKIVVISGRNTFSAAQIFITTLNKDTKAIFAGEPSASSPNFVGEGNYITLPWSGAMGSISNIYHEIIPGDKRKWIEPEIKVELSSEKYFTNEDPVLAEIFKLADKNKLPHK